MKTRTYKVSELRRMIKESSNEFKPKLGNNVEKENKANNEKAYKDAQKNIETYDGGVKQSKAKSKSLKYPNDGNRGMANLEYDNEGGLPEKFVADNRSRLKGYVSDMDEKLHSKDATPVEYNDHPEVVDHAKKVKDKRIEASLRGITSKPEDKKEIEQLRSLAFEEKAPTYRFKRTVFLNEEHMLSIMPDESKKENKKSIVEDMRGTQYYVIWHEDKPEVVNKTKVNEDYNKAVSLMGFKSKELHTTNRQRVNEDKMVENMMNKIRSLTK